MVYTNHILERRNLMKKMMTLLAIGAIGYTGFSMYKKYNPDYKRDVREYVDKMAKKVNKMNEDMM
jgi:hypothetical protein